MDCLLDQSHCFYVSHFTNLFAVDDISGGKKGSCGDLVLICHNAGCGPPPRAKKSPLKDAAPNQLPNLGLIKF